MKAINALLGELSKVEGAVLNVRFSRDLGVTQWFGVEAEGRPCDCSIEHNGWGMARAITLTIYVGGVDVSALELPPIQGRSGVNKPRK